MNKQFLSLLNLEVLYFMKLGPTQKIQNFPSSTSTFIVHSTLTSVMNGHFFSRNKFYPTR